MVLPDHEIRKLGERGLITPYDEGQVQPSSYDVRLGVTFRVFTNHNVDVVDLADPDSWQGLTSAVADESGLLLHPGEFVLGHTVEIVTIPPELVARIEGKSSLGRLGLIVHATAGYIDPGFHGAITLEMTNLLRVPIRLRPGLPIAQLSFSQLTSPPSIPYRGRYQGDLGVGESRYGKPLPRDLP